MSQTVEKKKKDLPVWAGILLIAIGVLGAGAFVWWQVSGFWSRPSGVFSIEGVEPGVRPQVRRGQMAPPRVALNVREISSTQWRVRTQAYTLDVKKDNGNLVPAMSVSSMRVLPEDAQWVMVSKPRLDNAAAQQIGLSADQVAKFKALPTNIRHDMTLTSDQAQQLKTSFQKYLDAPANQKQDIEQEVSNTINSVGQAGMPALAGSIQAKYDEFKKTVTPDQLAKLKQLATAAPAAAAAAPAAPAAK
jgi:hypothetical protein